MDDFLAEKCPRDVKDLLKSYLVELWPVLVRCDRCGRPCLYLNEGGVMAKMENYVALMRNGAEEAGEGVDYFCGRCVSPGAGAPR